MVFEFVFLVVYVCGLYTVLVLHRSQFKMIIILLRIYADKENKI